MFKTKVVSTVDNNDNHMESPNDVITERFKAFNKAIELSGQKDYKNALPWFACRNKYLVQEFQDQIVDQVLLEILSV